MTSPRLDPPPSSADLQIDPRVNAWLEIDLQALAENLLELRSRLAPKTQVMAIVKADAYGHGAVQASRALLAAGAERLGVANVLEAEQLRQAGVAAPILVLGPLLPDQLDTALDLDLEVMLSSARAAEELAAAAACRQVRARAHVKVDTGMGRVGLLPDDAVALLRQWDSLQTVDLAGVCTHFAAAEDQLEFTRSQLARFHDVVHAAGPVPMRHAANSAGILALADSHLDCVRPGLALYGAMRGPGAPSRPVMRLRARLTQVKDMPAGSTLGYSRTFIVRRPMRVGLVPLGYADGLPRALSNRQDVLVGGHRCHLVGMISMDQSLVDLSGIDAAPGDDVVLIGEQGGERITANEWADACGTIPYEILCRLGSSRLGRFYTT